MGARICTEVDCMYLPGNTASNREVKRGGRQRMSLPSAREQLAADRPFKALALPMALPAGSQPLGQADVFVHLDLPCVSCSHQDLQQRQGTLA